MVSNRGAGRSSRPRAAATTHLTPLQVEILRLAAEGLEYKQIARRLGKSKRTIEGQVAAMFTRTGTRNKGELIVRASRSGLVPTGWDTFPGGVPDPRRGLSEGPDQHSVIKESLCNLSCGGTTFQQRPQRVVDNETLRIDAPDGVLNAIASIAVTDAQRGGYPVRDGPAVSANDVLDAWCRVKRDRDRLDRVERTLIDLARRRGVTWVRIGQALGVGTAQAAQQRRKRLGGPDGCR